MPAQKKSGKWYWGTKGPFDTEKEARAVEKAAYSNGYKGKPKKRKK